MSGMCVACKTKPDLCPALTDLAVCTLQVHAHELYIIEIPHPLWKEGYVLLLQHTVNHSCNILHDVNLLPGEYVFAGGS